MNVRELMEVLSHLDPELEVVARYPHCCGRHNYAGRRLDTKHIFGATEDAWWVPKVEVTRVGGMDPETKETTPFRDVVGIEGDYPYEVLDEEDDAVSARLMCSHRRHERSYDEEKRGE